MMRSLTRALPAVVLLVLAVGVWEAVVRSELVSALILPRPGDVATATVDLVAEGLLWEHLFATLIETLAGFGIGSGLAIVLAVGAGMSELVRRAVYPYVISLQVTPLIAVAPLIVAWLGFGYSSKIAIAALICFFPVFVNTLAGMVSVGAQEREMFRSLGANRVDTFRRLLLPAAAPTMFAGLKTAMTLALIGAVVGEFVSAERGLGLLVSRFSYQLAVPEAFAVVLVLTLVGLVLFAAMVAVETYVVFWKHDARLLSRTRRRQRRDDQADPAARPQAPGSAATGAATAHHEVSDRPVEKVSRSMTWNRTVPALAVAAVVATTVVACSGDDERADGLTTVTWAQPTPESMAYHPYVIADELGYFEDEGLFVELAPASEDLPTTTLVSNGSADIAAASANEIFYALDAGADLTVFYDAMTSTPEGLVVPADSDVETAADLAGATVGIPSEEEQAIVSSSLEAEGASAEDVSFVTIGGSGQVLADQLDEGQIDAFAGSLLDFATVQAVGYELRDVTPEVVAGTPAGALVARPDVDREVLEGFLRAFARATAYAEENPEGAEEILRERIPEEWQNEDVASSLLEAGLGLWIPEDGVYGAIRPERWSAAQERLVAAEGAGADVDLDVLLDDSLVAPANEW